MSAEHRKPLAAFVALAFVAVVVVGVQRADAQSGHFLASVVGSTQRVHGLFPQLSASPALAREHVDRLEPAFGAIVAHEQHVREQRAAAQPRTGTPGTSRAGTRGAEAPTDGATRLPSGAAVAEEVGKPDVRRVALAAERAWGRQQHRRDGAQGLHAVRGRDTATSHRGLGQRGRDRLDHAVRGGRSSQGRHDRHGRHDR